MKPRQFVVCAGILVGLVACASPASVGDAAVDDAGASAVRPIEIPVGDLTFDGLEAGPADGELVLLLHGFPQTADAFRAQLPALAAAGYRAVAVNQRGYSPGARPADTAAYTMANLVTDVGGIADALDADAFHLVGHDWGGAVAWVFATLSSDRVRSLTVLSTPHFAALTATRGSADSDQAQRSSYFDTLSQPGAEIELLADDAAGLRAFYGTLDDASVANYIGRLGTPEALRAALAWYVANFGGAQSRTPPNPAPVPPPVTVPTLYVWGTEDSAFGREAAEATAGHVSGPYRFEAIDGAGHWLPEQAAARVTALILEHLSSR